MENFAIDSFRIVGASLVSFILAYLWYSDKLFGNSWAKLNNLSKDFLKKEDSDLFRKFSIIFTMNVFISVGFFLLTFFFESYSGFLNSLILGLFLSFLFVLPPAFSNYLLSNKRIKLFLIDYGYVSLSIVLISLIIGI